MKRIEQMEIDNPTVEEKLEVIQEFKQAIERIIKEEKLEAIRKDREERNIARVDYSDPEENTGMEQVRN